MSGTAKKQEPGKVGYVVRPRADRDIDEIAEYLADEIGLDIAVQFLGEISQTFGLLAAQQHIGWPCKVRHPQLLSARTFRVNARFEKDLIFYQSHSERIEILRIVHGFQDLEKLFNQQGID